MGEAWAARKRGQVRGKRRGSVFGVRLTVEERERLEAAQGATAGPDALGPWLVWAAERAHIDGVLPARGGNTQPRRPGSVVPDQVAPAPVVPPRSRIILDLCAGSGSWSAPYEAAGYDVRRVTLPTDDVRLFAPPESVWGILAAPPCTEFSLAKNGQPRDFLTGLEVVGACARVVLAARPQWWALENPTGYLSNWLGMPRAVFEPYEFGDPWTKRTALWGNFTLPKPGPFVEPQGSAMDRATAAERAITPPGFARAFFEANP